LPQAPDRLSERERGRDDVEQGRKGDVHPAGFQPPAEHAAGDPAPDAEAPLPDGKDPGWVAACVLLPARGDRVQAGADEAGHDRPKGDRDQRAPEAPETFPATLGEPSCDEHPRRDQKTIKMQLERPQGDAVRRRARYVCQHAAHQATPAKWHRTPSG
jgi:hypothetical protein